MTKFLKLTSVILVIFALVVTGCSAAEEPATEEPTTEQPTIQEEQVVNLYTDRHYDTDAALYELFEQETGIKVNVVKAKSDELIERLEREGEDTEADLLITADAGRLFRAKDKGLLQAVESEILNANVPAKLVDADKEWYALTKRARVIVYSKDRVTPDQLSTYEALTNPEWEGKVLVRSSENIYNQSLMASLIAINGEEAALEWATNLVKNMARVPAGNDRDQAKAIVAGEGDVAIMNTYYVGKMVFSSDAEEVKVAEQVGVFFPNQDTTGTHVNISGIAMTKHAKNNENAIKLMEFLSGETAQKQFADANFEYPVNPNVEPSELLKSWGEFKEQDINLTVLGENNSKAVQLFLQADWQ